MSQTFYTVLVQIFVRILINSLRRLWLFFTWLEFFLIVLLIGLFFKIVFINLLNHGGIIISLFLVDDNIVVQIYNLSFWVYIYLLCLLHQCVWWLYYLVLLFTALILFILLSISTHFTQILFFYWYILELCFLLVLVIHNFVVHFFFIFLVLLFF
jgi:hypothetical protein